MGAPAEKYDGWRLDVGTTWEAYNRIYFSYKRSETETENYLRRLYRSHFVVFSYSFIDALISNILMLQLGLSKSEVSQGSLRAKIEKLDRHKSIVGVLSSFDVFWSDLNWLRNELIHPKRIDHVTPNELDALDIAAKVQLLNSFSILAYQSVDLEFPYWLTGWNYVNSMMTDSVSQGIVLIDNQEFKARLSMMLGYHDPRHAGQALEIVKNYMVGQARYNAICAHLDSLGFETQPIPSNPEFPDDTGFDLMPLLTKVWWDRDKMRDLRATRQRKAKLSNKA